MDKRQKLTGSIYLSAGNEGFISAYLNVITVFDANDFACVVWSCEND